MNNFILKECNLQEIENIKHISEKTFAETFQADNTKEDMDNYFKSHFSYEQIESEVRNPYSKFIIVRDNEDVVGYMKINFDKAQTEKGYTNTLEVQRIYVMKEYKGKRIGQLLMQHAIKVAKDNRLKYIWLGVWEHNDSAIRFYEKLGFRKFSTHVFKLGDDEQTDNLMKLDLEV